MKKRPKMPQPKKPLDYIKPAKIKKPGSDTGLFCALCKLASRKGFEPLTPGLGNLCSILLSYRELDGYFNLNRAARKEQ